MVSQFITGNAMETFIVILVLIILFVLLGGAAWFFGKEAGPGSGMAWLTGTRQIRGVFTGLGNGEKPFTSTTSQTSAVMVDDPRMDELREELNRTLALGEGLENRLRALEHEITQTRQLPQALDARVLDSEKETRARLSQIRREFRQLRKADSPYGVRRNDAVRDLYQKLAQLEVALGAVVNPLLLPGEPVTVPETLYEETLEWDNWGDVADHAFTFGEAFSKNRVLLDPDLADRVEGFIASFREALTGTVYPIVQGDDATPQQRKQIRAGIVAVVEGITPIRREFEQTWLHGTRMDDIDDEEDEDFDA